MKPTNAGCWSGFRPHSQISSTPRTRVAAACRTQFAQTASGRGRTENPEATPALDFEKVDANASDLLSAAVVKMSFRPATTTNVEAVGEDFRLLSMRGAGLRGVKTTPGQTVQVYLGNLTERAYTPMDLDPDAGSAQVLFYLHGKGPGSAWASFARVGDNCQVMRSKDSIDFAAFAGFTLFFGDKTSLAAAQALERSRGQSSASRYVFEVSSPAQAEVIFHRFGVSHKVLVQKREDGSHLSEVVAQMEQQAGCLQSPQ